MLVPQFVRISGYKLRLYGRNDVLMIGLASRRDYDLAPASARARCATPSKSAVATDHTYAIGRSSSTVTDSQPLLGPTKLDGV